MTDSVDDALRIVALTEQLRVTERSNRVAAILTDTCRQNFEELSEHRGDQSVPVDVVLGILDGVLSALAGVTDWRQLHSIHPDVTPLAYARLQVLLDNGS